MYGCVTSVIAPAMLSDRDMLIAIGASPVNLLMHQFDNLMR
jgi:hypothetical protein